MQLAEAAGILNARIVRRWQLEGVTILDPATTWIDVTATLAPDVTVLPNTHILRATAVAQGATIGPDTRLVDCEVGERATVKRADATLAVIGAGATVGPSPTCARHVLGANGKIGTFVETKNSTIGEGSKVPHLSYVGDTTIGAGVNLGAGAITANYDDITKHRTEIGDQVHAGSHNVFVAPVRIGAGAKTGAGAVIRKDVPPGALALCVAPQRNIEGWVEKNRPGTAAAEAPPPHRRRAMARRRRRLARPRQDIAPDSSPRRRSVSSSPPALPSRPSPPRSRWRSAPSSCPPSTAHSPAARSTRASR